jgi:hypothetical protein
MFRRRPLFGPAVYVTYNEDGYYIGETSKGIRSRNSGGRGVDLDNLVIALPAPTSKRDRCAVETGLIQSFISLGLPVRNRKLK